ncbi:glycoside hydrolase family 3 C-terminal domain-containing protein [Microbacterium sp. ZW T5_45]|uniref:glycoside hydrolase family 3 protein n=1 Tax=Microbacterium sp. ZW T5_45 TaxID=3378080 RepID=UPI003853BDF5
MSTTTETGEQFECGVRAIRGGADLQAETEKLLNELTRDEKLALLDGDDEFWPGLAEMMKGYNTVPIVMGRIDRLGIPGLRFSDGPRGAVVGRSTAFPVSMARGATWDVELEERIGEAIGAELRAQGANFFGGVCINLPRHPAWGRSQETYGEDSLALGEFGAALTRGVRRHAMAVAKHYALNSMENARFTVDVTADDATLHEVYLPHFRRAVEEGVDGIMTAYNSVNGEWAGENETLMEGILRGEWGFTGVTVSDFIFGLRDPARSLHAGLDVEEPFRQQRAQHLPADLEEGRASWDDVDRAARRILSTQLAFASRDLAPEPGPDVVFSLEHRQLARDAAASAAVLVQNEPIDGVPVLPLNAGELSRLAVIGRLADIANTGDGGSSSVRSPEVVTPLQGLVAALPDVDVVFRGEDDARLAADAALGADAAIVVVGYTAEDEGEFLGDLTSDPTLQGLFPPPPEGIDPSVLFAAADGDEAITMGTAMGGDRTSLRVRPVDAEIIRAVAAANPRTVVVIVTAGAVITEEWRHSVPAILVGWYDGSEGGHALADVLLGEHDATGRLPYSIPTDESHLPYFDIDATTITYDRWHGQRLLDRDGRDAAFPLGFGLSYTTFGISEVSVENVEGEHFDAHVTVSNTGERPGRHVVQIYGVLEAEDFPRRVLLGFAPVELAPGETTRVAVRASLRPTNRWSDGGFVPATDRAVIEASAYSGDPAAARTTLDLV